jgi:DivIVA domain-containing protein
MNAKEISSRKFDRGFNGYKPDEVDEFLKEIAAEFTQLQKDNRDLEKKLEVLADKVREYRDDEDALKEALLGAQKQGHAAIAAAKEKAKEIVEEAQKKADTSLEEARAASEKLNNDAEETMRKANEEARKTHEESTVKQAKMEAEYREKLDVNKEILYKTKNEVIRFRQKLLEDFTRVTRIIDALPEVCENEFISKTLTEYSKDRNVTLKKPAIKPAPLPVPDSDKKKPDGGKPAPKGEQIAGMEDLNAEAQDSDSLFEEFAAHMVVEKKPTSFEVKLEEKLLADLTTEINFEPVFDEEESGEVEAISPDEFSADGKEPEKKETEVGGGESDNPFFKKSAKEPKEQLALEFGNNAKGRKK